MILQKPKHLKKGDTIATLSISHGWAGDSNVTWKYELGKKRLSELYGLTVVAAPNSMKGSEYLTKNPKARADDIQWAFENKEVNALIANIGGNDSIKVIPFVDKKVIRNNPKIFIGYSDVLNLHLLCYHCGLSSFYGHNLLTTVAEAQGFHPYSEKWFRKVLFDPSPIGKIELSADFTYEENDFSDKDYVRAYYPNAGVWLIQGKGKVQGRLIGGHSMLMELGGTGIELAPEDYHNAIFFFEDIPEYFFPEHIGEFFDWLGKVGILQRLKGIIIGKANEDTFFKEQAEEIRKEVCERYDLCDLPILYGLNFGHSSPMFILPFGAMAEINCEEKSFSILESGVI